MTNLKMHNNQPGFKNLIRFTTAGSVDDGKSTLIGRLLYDTKSIFEDQFQHISESSKRLGRQEIDLSLLTDGLRAEREQGITIDVAYRYFATPSRKFIIADTPGHTQYTRNMVTGASTADLAVILVDARTGVLEQTLRHTFIASLLDIRYIIFCINKMDLVNYSESAFNSVKISLTEIAKKLSAENVYFIPISAKYGDNVVHPSENMPWFKGQTLIQLLENIEIPVNKNPNGRFRLPVQTVIRPHSDDFHDFRGYAGRISGGVVKTGDEIIILPYRLRSKIKSINIFNKSLTEAYDGDSVTITLEDDIDIGRGNLICSADDIPRDSSELTATICWFNEVNLQTGRKYILRNHTNETLCIVKSVNYILDINTLKRNYSENNVRMNDIAEVVIKASQTIFYDPYRKNNVTGSFILIDEFTNETVAAGMIERDY